MSGGRSLPGDAKKMHPRTAGPKAIGAKAMFAVGGNDDQDERRSDLGLRSGGADAILSEGALRSDRRAKGGISLDEVSEFALFRAIVETGGISAAALALQSSPAAVSRRLSALEAKLGVRLAERSSRRFRLTDEGLLLYERSRSILDQIRDAEAEVASRGGTARGLLRIGAPADFGRKHIAPLLPAFTARHPGLDAHLVLSDIGLENEADGCDLVFRVGLPADPTMIARKIATTRHIVCAAPTYIARRGAPRSPEELHGHNCLRLARRHRLIDRWHFVKQGNDVEVHVTGTLSSGDGSVLRAWAESGEGISWEAYWDIADDLAAGRLIELLPDYRSSSIELYAVFAAGKPVPPRIRLFVDHMLQMMKQFTRDEIEAEKPVPPVAK